MTKPLSFQGVILRMQDFWAERGCLIWQPYSEKVGAGTMNPATVLRVLGPEPWNVAYVEPSYRPDDGRYGDNPNRMQMHTQFQVILKPDPGNPQEQYLESLYALGIQREEHDIRFVEDNWESPALGAWGLGWEVWLDGLEITQFTYFQQAGGYALDPVSVELTYGLERIAMFLQNVRSVWEINWDGTRTYGDVLLQPEIEHCRYDFELADVDRLTQMYNLYEAEAKSCLEAGLVIPAHDYVLRCSHTFNVLDARGAIGVTERATYFRRMRDLARQVAVAYVEQRQRLEYPWLSGEQGSRGAEEQRSAPTPPHPRTPTPLLLEIGTEELPAGDLDDALAQLRELVPARLEEARLDYESLRVLGTPRRLAVLVEGLAPHQRPVEELVKGPPKRVAFDSLGQPTKAAEGFARKFGLGVEELEVREINGGEYMVAVNREEGLPTAEVLSALLPELIAGLRFGKSMRWNASDVAFSRPIRWLVALLGDTVVPFEYAGLTSGRTSHSSRPQGSAAFEIACADEYPDLLAKHKIVVDPEERCGIIAQQATELAQSAGGMILDDPALLAEVTNLVEQPTALLGHFEEEYLKLPDAVLIAVMEKHQRYFPVVDADAGKGEAVLRQGEVLLRPYFVVVRNGGEEHLDIVQHGNEEVILARFADADFFYREDAKRPLEAFLPRLDTLTFQEQLGSMLDKTKRLEKLVPQLAEMLGLSAEETKIAQRAAHLCKADLATQMVVEFTSLQGVMGREYALKSGEDPAVAEAIFEHYLPRFARDALPETKAGLVLGLADRLDSLLGLFRMGLIPTGSADPYQLRRDAIGVIQNLVTHQISLSLSAAIQVVSVAGQLPRTPKKVRFFKRAEFRTDPDAFAHPGKGETHILSPSAEDSVVDFIARRLRVLLRSQGHAHDVVEAVFNGSKRPSRLADEPHLEWVDDPHRAWVAVEELSRWVARDDWSRILDNYARCVRITTDNLRRWAPREPDKPANPARFEQPAEEELYTAYQEARAKVSPRGSVNEFLTAFLPLVDIIDRYFAKESGVLVMDEDRTLRENRLAQLQHIAALAEGIVNLSKMEGF